MNQLINGQTSIVQESRNYSWWVLFFPVATITKSIHSFGLYQLFVQKDLWYTSAVLKRVFFVIRETNLCLRVFLVLMVLVVFQQNILRVYGVYYVVYSTLWKLPVLKYYNDFLLTKYSIRNKYLPIITFRNELDWNGEKRKSETLYAHCWLHTIHCINVSQ